MFPIHQVWPKPSCKAQWKGEEDKEDRGRGGRTTSRNGQAWSSASPRGRGEQGKMEKTGCKIICGAPTTLAVKGLMMMMMIHPSGTIWQDKLFRRTERTCCNLLTRFFFSSKLRKNSLWNFWIIRSVESTSKEKLRAVFTWRLKAMSDRDHLLRHWN